MKALTLSPAAEADLDHIWDHSAEHWGPDQADRYTDEIRDACHDLASGIRGGRTVDVRPGYLNTPPVRTWSISATTATGWKSSASCIRSKM